MAGTKDIKEFTKYPSLSDNDYLLGTKTDLGGTDAGITVADFKKLVAQDVKPTIKNGYWWVNGVNTGELATGRTPQFRYTVNGMEMKYDNEDDTAFRVIIPIEDLLFTFDDLTLEQVELLKLKFSDLTEAEKNELRGKAFTYGDFTPEQLADLRLTWDKLTPAQKKELQGERGYSAFEVWEQQEGNTGKTVDDYLSWLRLPATSVALAIREEMDQIAEEAEEVIRETNAAGEDADKAAIRANKAAEAAEGIVAGIVPTKTSDLENDSGFITKVVDDLANYLLKSETYTREEVLNLISQIKGVGILPVEVLPDTGETNIIYFLPKEGAEDDVYDEYIWISGKWERIGSTSIDLLKYYTKEDADNRYVLKMLGKRLMTDEEGEKLAGIEAGANKFEYPADPVAGQVLTWRESGAVWGDVSGGSDILLMGSFRTVGSSSTAEQKAQVLNGHTYDEILDAVLNNKPMYTMFDATSPPMGYAAIKSATRRVDGTNTYIYMVAEYYNGFATPTDYCLEKRLLMIFNNTTGGLTGMSALGKLLSGYDSLTFSSIPFNGGSVFGFISDSDGTWTPRLTFPHGNPNEGDETSVIMVNSYIMMAWSNFTLGSDAPAGTRLLMIDDFVNIENGQAVEINIKYMNKVFNVRVSEPFNYSS